MSAGASGTVSGAAIPKSASFTQPSARRRFRRLHIAVNDALRVRIVECVGDLAGDVNRRRDGEHAAGVEYVAQRPALDQFHDDEVEAAFGAVS